MASKKGAPKEGHATDAEVDAAIRSLSEADFLRLEKIAAFRARMLLGLGLGMSADDLLQEAIARTLDGGCDRHWRKGVSFVKHLDETMRSITSHAPDELKGGMILPAGEDETEAIAKGGIALHSQLSDAEQIAAAHEQLEAIGERFASDEMVALVAEGLSTGMSGPEIQKDLQITPTQYETIMTRLRRGIDRKEGWRP